MRFIYVLSLVLPLQYPIIQSCWVDDHRTTSFLVVPRKAQVLENQSTSFAYRHLTEYRAFWKSCIWAVVLVVLWLCMLHPHSIPQSTFIDFVGQTSKEPFTKGHAGGEAARLDMQHVLCILCTVASRHTYPLL